MREYIVLTLVLLLTRLAAAQTPPAGWKWVKDSKGLCQVAIPSEWVSLGDNSGAAVLREATNAIAAVTSQPGQAFKPLPESILKSLEVPKDKLFENSAKRIFYQERTSKGSEDPSAYSSSVPGRDGMCSCHVVFLPSVDAEITKKIVLSLGPVPADPAGPEVSR